MLRKFLCLIAAGFIWNANAAQGVSALYKNAPEVCMFFGGVMREIDSRVTNSNSNRYTIEFLEDLFSSFIVKLNAHAAEFDETLLNEVSMWFNGPTMLAQQKKTDNITVVDAFLGVIIRASKFLTNDFDDIKSYASSWKNNLKNNTPYYYSLSGTISEAKAILNVQ